MADVTFTSIADATSVYLEGETLDLEVGPLGPMLAESSVYLFLGPCSLPAGSFSDIDVSHYLNRVPAEEAVRLPDTGSSSILAGLFVSVTLISCGFTLMVVSRRTRQSGSA